MKTGKNFLTVDSSPLMKNGKKALLEFILVLTFFVVLMLIFRQFKIDLAISSRVYEINSFEISSFLQGLAWLGKYLAVIFCGFLLIALPWMWKKNHKYKKEVLFAILLLIIGPGFINNIILKPLFKRPRPVEISQYNKESSINYVPPLSIGTKVECRSFPSGHAAAAYFFIFPWFCLRFRKRFGILLIVPGLIIGAGTSTLRILEGRHFLSDTIASLTLIYLTAVLLSSFMFPQKANTLD